MPGKLRKRKGEGFFRRHASTLRKVLVCIVLAAVCVVPALFVNNLIGYLPLLMVLCALVYLGVYSLVIRSRVTFEELSSLSDCERGSRVDFTVRIKNGSPLLLSRVEPCFYISDLFGEDESLMRRVTTLAPFEERDFNFSVRFDHIGTYSAGLRSICIYDLLGLFTFTITNTTRYEVTVSPKIFEVGHLQVANELTSESQKMLASVINDGMDYAGMRDYSMGDPMKSVHWKMSARSRKLMTKLYETYINPTMAIIFDFHSYPYDSETMMGVFDAVVEAGMSLDHYAHGANIDSTLVFRDRRGYDAHVKVNSLEEYTRLVDQMPKISASEHAGVAAELVSDEVNNPFAANNIVVCTSCFDEKLISTLAAARNRGKNPVLLGVIPRSLPEEERKRITRPLRFLDEVSAPFFFIDSADELKEKLR